MPADNAADAPANYAYSLIRTLVPTLISALMSLPAATWLIDRLHLDSTALQQTISSIMIFALASIYYATVRRLEREHRWVGWLLGSPARPTYERPAGR